MKKQFWIVVGLIALLAALAFPAGRWIGEHLVGFGNVDDARRRGWYRDENIEGVKNK